jgi:hypothetical protein
MVDIDWLLSAYLPTNASLLADVVAYSQVSQRHRTKHRGHISLLHGESQLAKAVDIHICNIKASPDIQHSPVQYSIAIEAKLPNDCSNAGIVRHNTER